MNEKLKNLQTLSLPKVAEYLCISVRGVYRLGETNALPIIKVGGLNRVRVSDLEAFLDRHSTANGVPA